MLTREDIILLFLEDPKKLADEIRKGNILKSDEIRTLICELGNPQCAYWYANYIDVGPTNETRTTCCKDPEEAYFYARFIDRKETRETWLAVQNDRRIRDKYLARIRQKLLSDL